MCYKILNDKGIDAYLGATQLKPVEIPMGSKYKQPKETNDLFENIIYLPIHKNVPLNVIMKICREVVDACEKVKANKDNKLRMPKL
jgi:perosamine synthetase